MQEERKSGEARDDPFEPRWRRMDASDAGQSDFFPVRSSIRGIL
jgi:hypothetical protein